MLGRIDVGAGLISDCREPALLVDLVEVEVGQGLLATRQLGADPQQLDGGADAENGNETDDCEEDVPPQPSASWRPSAS
jgi:hypothetical protein